MKRNAPHRTGRSLRGALLAAAWLGSACLPAQEIPPPKKTPRQLPGVQLGGEVLLPNQWSLSPAGKQIKVGDFPVNLVLHPKEPFAAVLHAGFSEHEVVILDLKKGTITGRVTVPQAFCGLVFSPDGKELYASGAEHEVVHRFKFDAGLLHDHREIPVSDGAPKFVTCGLAISGDGKTLYVCNGWGQSLMVVPLADPTARRRVEMPKESYPYAAVLSRDGKTAYVSLWAAKQVAVVDLEKFTVKATWPVSPHPTEMVLSPDEKVLYVSCASDNHAVLLDTGDGETLEIVATSLYPKARPGSTPNSLALSADGRVLLVANADNNNLAVFDVSTPGKSRSLGYIPTGWYPTSVRIDAADGRILVANGKGLASQDNRLGPQPGKEFPAGVREYIGSLFRGTVSLIPFPNPKQMAEFTRLSYRSSPLRSDEAPTGRPREENHPIPAKLGGKSPLKHCIYIIKENRTYDQVFGDLPEGNGEASLCLFPEEITPNQHALAREFVLLDNFYVEGEVSADGHEWTMAAYATDFTEKSWPLVYRGGGRGKLAYPGEGGVVPARPDRGYFWDQCKRAGVSYYTFGEFVDDGPPFRAKIPALEGHFDPKYRPYDLNVSDQVRADRFIEALKEFEAAGKFPQFVTVHLPNDHTQGAVPGRPTPAAMVADNDLALGRIVEAVSNSRFWKETAIFVVQDDAQNGPDHIDAHRSIAQVISPYTKRKTVDSTMYSTSSMLRTMELILNVEPMSQFDAAARPMYECFGPTLDATPFKHRAARIALTSVNKPDAWGAALSLKMDFSKEDAADDILLNRIVWKSIRGADSPMPAPVRASFFYAEVEDEEGDDDDG